MDDASGTRTVGERIQAARTRAGMSRPLLAGLIGMSPEWLKAVETGRQLMPRLGKLIDLATALRDQGGAIVRAEAERIVEQYDIPA